MLQDTLTVLDGGQPQNAVEELLFCDMALLGVSELQDLFLPPYEVMMPRFACASRTSQTGYAAP